MSDDNDTPSDALESARAKRVQLKTAVSAVEIAAAAPAADPDWRANLVRELGLLQVGLDQHVEEVESPDGLLAELATDAPRLINPINRLRDEHPDLCRQVAATLESARSDTEPADLRGVVLETLIAIARHRQHGADLVYEAYNVDIGGDA